MSRTEFVLSWAFRFELPEYRGSLLKVEMCKEDALNLSSVEAAQASPIQSHLCPLQPLYLYSGPFAAAAFPSVATTAVITSLWLFCQQ